MHTVAALALFLTLGSRLAQAQYGPGATGIYWSGTTTQGGTPCFGFSCTPIPMTVHPGETGTLTLIGEFQQPWALGISAGASQCTTVPAILNRLILDAPITLVASGTLNQVSSILACPPGLTVLPITIPLSAQLGTSFDIQAVVGSFGLLGPQLAFTSALHVSVN